MSRSKRERETSRVAQIHYCAICWEEGNGRTKGLTWMLEIPPESDTYIRLGGRARTWFCRDCVTEIVLTDPIFSEKTARLELLNPDWWNHSASEAQHDYFEKLLEKVTAPDGLLDEVLERGKNATKGDMTTWISRLMADDIQPFTVLPRRESATPTETVH